jgi:hypothetical protein
MSPRRRSTALSNFASVNVLVNGILLTIYFQKEVGTKADEFSNVSRPEWLFHFLPKRPEGLRTEARSSGDFLSPWYLNSNTKRYR